MKRLTIGALVAGALLGCAPYQPMIDTKGVDMSAYQRDLAECQQYATQYNEAAPAAAGGAIGAVLGAAISGIVGGDGWVGAGVGAVSGVASGAGAGMEGKNDIVRRCIAGRGYRVLS